MSKDIGDSVIGPSPFNGLVLTAGGSDNDGEELLTVSSVGTGIGGSGREWTTEGRATLFGDPLAVDLSFCNGNIGRDEDGVCVRAAEAEITGDVVRAGFPDDDPMLDTLACLFDTV